MDENTGALYKCTGAADGAHTWKAFPEGGGSSDSTQNVDLSGYVKSVNGNAPDENGNVEIAISGESADLTGYATEQWVQESYQPKGDYLTEHQSLDGYAKTEDIPEAYSLPVGGDELGGVKNGGNVTINADGTMTAPETGGGSVVVDTEMSDTSENPVQNKVVKAYVDVAISGSWLEVY